MKYLKKHEDFLRQHETTPRKELTELLMLSLKQK